MNLVSNIIVSVVIKMRVKIIVTITTKDIFKLDEIGNKGLASNGHYQDFDFCLTKAIREFIKKYEEE